MDCFVASLLATTPERSSDRLPKPRWNVEQASRIARARKIEIATHHNTRLHLLNPSSFERFKRVAARRMLRCNIRTPQRERRVKREEISRAVAPGGALTWNARHTTRRVVLSLFRDQTSSTVLQACWRSAPSLPPARRRTRRPPRNLRHCQR